MGGGYTAAFTFDQPLCVFFFQENDFYEFVRNSQSVNPILFSLKTNNGLLITIRHLVKKNAVWKRGIRLRFGTTQQQTTIDGNLSPGHPVMT